MASGDLQQASDAVYAAHIHYAANDSFVQKLGANIPCKVVRIESDAGRVYSKEHGGEYDAAATAAKYNCDLIMDFSVLSMVVPASDDTDLRQAGVEAYVKLVRPSDSSVLWFRKVTTYSGSMPNGTFTLKDKSAMIEALRQCAQRSVDRLVSETSMQAPKSG